MADTSQNLAVAALTFSVISCIALVIGLYMIFFRQYTIDFKSSFSYLSGKAGSALPAANTFKIFGALLGAFSPDITLLSGFVSDVINGTFRYSVTSMIAILAVIVHYLVGWILGWTKPSTDVAIAPTVASTVAAVTAPVTAPIEAAAAVLGVGGVGSTISAPPRPAAPVNVISRAATRAAAATRGPRSVKPRDDDDRRTVININTGAGGPPSEFNLGARDSSAQSLRPPPSIRGRGNKGLGPVFEGARPSRAVAMRGGALPAYMAGLNPCIIRGLGMFDVSSSPMGIAALSTVFTIYLADMTQKHSGTDIAVYCVFGGVVYGLNLFAYREFGCYGDGYGSIFKSTLVPMLIGGTVGGTAYALLKTGAPQYLPLDDKNIANTSAMPVATCGAPNDQDQFVCDAYKDGKRISTTTV